MKTIINKQKVEYKKLTLTLYREYNKYMKTKSYKQINLDPNLNPITGTSTADKISCNSIVKLFWQ